VAASDRVGGSSEPDPQVAETVARLRDGSWVVLRRICDHDRAAVTEFVDRLSEETVELRFCAPVRPASIVDAVLGSNDSDDRLAIAVETLGTPGRILAVGECVRNRFDRSRAQVTFLVEDDAQGLGTGGLLLQELLRRARLEGVCQLLAIVMSENLRMREVLNRSWYPYRVKRAGSAETYVLDLAAPESVGVVGWTPV
jgi:GNAT superfamily N-acetyltransferase